MALEFPCTALLRSDLGLRVSCVLCTAGFLTLSSNQLQQPEELELKGKNKVRTYADNETKSFLLQDKDVNMSKAIYFMK